MVTLSSKVMHLPGLLFSLSDCEAGKMSELAFFRMERTEGTEGTESEEELSALHTPAISAQEYVSVVTNVIGPPSW